MIPNSLKKRIRKHGYLITAWYVFTVFILPKIGIEIKLVYKKDNDKFSKDVIIPPQVSISILEKFDHLLESDKKALCSFEGEELLQRMKNDFNKGNLCVICKTPNDGLVGLGWVERLRKNNPSLNHYLCRDEFVFPEFRGKSYSPIRQVKTYLELLERSKNQNVTFFTNIVIGNYSSIRSAKKGGFRYYKTKLILFHSWEFVVHKV